MKQVDVRRLVWKRIVHFVIDNSDELNAVTDDLIEAGVNHKVAEGKAKAALQEVGRTIQKRIDRMGK